MDLTLKYGRTPGLPTPTTFKVISPINASCSKASVDSLIDRNVMRWNLDKLEQLFLPRDVAIIKQIPLSVRRPRDKLIWTGTKSGNFTVKSAYSLLLHQSSVASGSSSNGMGSARSLWSRIWSAQVPPKVRLFMWRACLDILPTKTKLFDKGLIHSVSCLWCEGEPESSSHVLWQCDFAQKIWMACPIIIPSFCSISMNFRDFILSCIDVLSESDTEILFTTAWEIWNARNRFHWENKLSTVNDIWQRAAALALDFKKAGLQAQAVGGGSVVPLASRWRPPDQGFFKINIGFSVDSQLNMVGVGCLVRDADGSVKAAMEQKMVLCDDKLQLQASVVLAAVKFAFDVGFRTMDVDISYNELYHLLQSDGPVLASIGTLVDDILLFKNSCSVCNFSLVKSLCNKAASALASEALSSATPQVSSATPQLWFDHCPMSVSSLVLVDSS